MKKSSKHIRSVINHSVRNRSVFVPLSAGFCATALAITGGVAANASAASSAVASSSVASSSSVVKSSTAKVAKKASSVTGGGRLLSILLFPLLQLILSVKIKLSKWLAARLKSKDIVPQDTL